MKKHLFTSSSLPFLPTSLPPALLDRLKVPKSNLSNRRRIHHHGTLIARPSSSSSILAPPRNMNIRRFQNALVGGDDALLALVAFFAGAVLDAGIHGDDLVAFGPAVAVPAGGGARLG